MITTTQPQYCDYITTMIDTTNVNVPPFIIWKCPKFFATETFGFVTLNK